MRYAWLLLFTLVAVRVQAAPAAEWTRAPAAASEWSSAKLAEATDYAKAHNVTALMVVRHGEVVVEWGDTTKPTELASVRKSLLSALVGLAVHRHQIDLDATLDRLGIDDTVPALSAEEKRATVRMLLEARSGIYHPALSETAGMAARRPPRFSHAPGTFWYYNNWDFNALGTIYERAAGTSIHQAFAREIARKIGMQDYDPAAQRYVRGAASLHPTYPFRMSARDLARFALLFLDGGRWNGTPVIPAEWVRESTRPHSDADWDFGYGYLWWTADAPTPRENLLRLPAGSYFAWGAGGQYAIVIPAEDLVIVERTDRDRHLAHPKPPEVAHLVELIRAACRP
ncbi:hypothetical protein DA075_13645 [Methylobacterium currus]|uniref:Beta-lactamase-related domain-containing protein n=1 Tax=Methylobacterium currus TaxID=2051553 RepID=A0A2R4WK07_9HYPH|nr:serine hydrolase [Methylobacterium currus]AWB21835.1 hypothetical protein DA075_13645 [Methylobacterium currus]